MSFGTGEESGYGISGFCVCSNFVFLFFKINLAVSILFASLLFREKIWFVCVQIFQNHPKWETQTFNRWNAVLMLHCQDLLLVSDSCENCLSKMCDDLEHAETLYRIVQHNISNSILIIWASELAINSFSLWCMFILHEV